VIKIRGTATALGAIRFGVCGIFLLQALDASFRNLGALPTTLMTPLGLMSRIPWGLFDALITPGGMACLKLVLCSALFLAAIGYRTRFTLFAALLMELLYQGILRSFSHFNHDEMAGLVILGILAVSPSGDGFSVDHLGRAPRAILATIRHGYPIVLAQAVIAWVYFSSGVLKLTNSGLAYFSTENLPVLAIRHSLDNVQDTSFRLAFWLPALSGLTPILTGLVVAWELTFPIGVFLTRARPWYLLMGICFHIGTMLLLNLMFWNMIAMYLVFVDWPRFFNWLARPRGPLPGLQTLHDWTAIPEEFPGTHMASQVAGRGELLWDGACGFCARMVGHLQRFLRRGVLARPFQEASGVPPEVTAFTSRQMHWVAADGSVLGGSRALVAALQDGGRPWLARILGSASVRPLTWLGYRLVAANRDNLGPLAGASCEVSPVIK
jgi:predicted DCC family thiol-disulfide oxidoreductase YuxK